MDDLSILWIGWCVSLRDQLEFLVKVVFVEIEVNEGYLDFYMSFLKEILCD